MEVCPEELSQLHRLAQALLFGVMGDRRQAQLLDVVARRLSALPTSPSLNHFATGLLGAVSELLEMRFELQLQPVLLLSHGLASGAPAILFARRHTRQSTGATTTCEAGFLAEPPSPPAATTPTAKGPAAGGRPLSRRGTSGASLRDVAEQQQQQQHLDAGDPGPAAVRAMILCACSVAGGPLSLGDLGICNAELGALQQQVLGLDADAVAAWPASGEAAAAAAGAADSAVLNADGSGAMRPVVAPRALSTDNRLKGSAVRPVSRTRFSRLRSMLPPGIGISIGIAGASWGGGGGGGGRNSSRLDAAHLRAAYMSNDSTKSVPAAAGAGAREDEDELRQPWLYSTAPEVLLETGAADASPIHTLVSSMRSGLTAALTGAMSGTMSGEESRSMVAQELTAIRLHKVIGHGGQGVVIRGTLHGLETAIKVIAHRNEPRSSESTARDAANAAGDRSDEKKDLHNMSGAKRGAMELIVTGALSHPNIVQVLASFSEVVLARCAFRGEPQPQLRLFTKDDPALGESAAKATLNTVVCLEYCDAGTLLAAARAGAFRPPGVSATFGAVRPALVPLYTSLLEIALALRYLHARRLVHCDVKPSNVLLKSSTRDPRGWNCKLSDFGCVQLMTEVPVGSSRHSDEDRRRLFGDLASDAAAASQAGGAGKATVLGFKYIKPTGTVLYMAPESFVRDRILGPSVDIYAFGILMHELLMCRPLYEGMDIKDVPRHVAQYHMRPEFDPLAPLEYVHLAGRCWSAHASRRPTATQLVRELEGLLEAAQRAEEKRLAGRLGAPVAPAMA
ncbi:hypothetical protein GPECTOR_33g545 [Gonium pectorale]|uniref:Protein kinase domain-containing protein n=1 Tax=Gonium pectorale TaxID=33097 RepID=A0A150GD07_GONPE|nr:hypothetical protein GPECTOR_33g545 [Gonium pectorale]|eukprot:KXZ47663.1 hypothetical protein GPECTOR_33g545 [Gonium pectorale]